VDDAPLFLAIKNGYFKQQGLTVTTQIIPQSMLAIPDMLHGTVDIIGTGNYVSFFEGQAKGAFNIKVLAAGSVCTKSNFCVLALPNSGISGPAGLAGKTIAVNLTNNIQTLMTDAELKANGVNPASVKYVVIPFPNMAAALKAGQVGDRVVVLTAGPGRVRADLPVDLAAPRDQITTKELPAFVRLRTEVSRLVRGQEGGPGGPADPGGAAGSAGAEYRGRDRYRSRAARASKE
jgi:archaellum component FlaG (FlaF/FlaG flagellin family)